MGARDKLRWRRLLNELKFLHEEQELIQDMCKEAGSLFQIHYEEFCAENNINLRELNQQHSQHIQKIYNEKKKENPEVFPLLSGLPVLHKRAQAAREEADSPYQMTKDEIEMHESFRKIFHKLALILHPDKLPADLSAAERQEKLDLFKKAKNALEGRQYFILLELARTYNIKLPRNYKQQTQWMKREIDRLTGEIEMDKKTYNYRFAEAESKQQKDQIVRSFMRQLFGLEIPQNNA